MLRQRLPANLMGTLHQEKAVSRLQVSKLLNQARGPSHPDNTNVLRLTKAEHDLLRMLRKETRSRFKPLGLTVYLYPGADCIAVRSCALQPECNGPIRSCAV